MDGILGGDPEPDIIVSRDAAGTWSASGPLARSTDVGATKPELFETLARGRPPDAVVEVREGNSSWTTDIRTLKAHYGRDYGPTRSQRRGGGGGDPYFDF